MLEFMGEVLAEPGNSAAAQSERFGKGDEIGTSEVDAERSVASASLRMA